eukprot:g6357.t1
MTTRLSGFSEAFERCITKIAVLQPLQKDQQQEMVKKRVEKLQAQLKFWGQVDAQPQLQELAENPLMLTMMISVFNELGERLPERRSQMYSKALHAVLKRITDERVDKRGRENLFTFLGYLASASHARSEEDPLNDSSGRSLARVGTRAWYEGVVRAIANKDPELVKRHFRATKFVAKHLESTKIRRHQQPDYWMFGGNSTRGSFVIGPDLLPLLKLQENDTAEDLAQRTHAKIGKNADGKTEYRFSHLTFQEHMVAQHMVDCVARAGSAVAADSPVCEELRGLLNVRDLENDGPWQKLRNAAHRHFKADVLREVKAELGDARWHWPLKAASELCKNDEQLQALSTAMFARPGNTHDHTLVLGAGVKSPGAYALAPLVDASKLVHNLVALDLSDALDLTTKDDKDGLHAIEDALSDRYRVRCDVGPFSDDAKIERMDIGELKRAMVALGMQWESKQLACSTLAKLVHEQVVVANMIFDPNDPGATGTDTSRGTLLHTEGTASYEVGRRVRLKLAGTGPRYRFYTAKIVEKLSAKQIAVGCGVARWLFMKPSEQRFSVARVHTSVRASFQESVTSDYLGWLVETHPAIQYLNIVDCRNVAVELRKLDDAVLEQHVKNHAKGGVPNMTGTSVSSAGLVAYLAQSTSVTATFDELRDKVALDKLNDAVLEQHAKNHAGDDVPNMVGTSVSSAGLVAFLAQNTSVTFDELRDKVALDKLNDAVLEQHAKNHAKGGVPNMVGTSQHAKNHVKGGVPNTIGTGVSADGIVSLARERKLTSRKIETVFKGKADASHIERAMHILKEPRDSPHNPRGEAGVVAGKQLVFTLENRMRTWTVPANGRYRIEAKGARAADGKKKKGGRGAVVRATFVLKAGDRLTILVGGASKLRPGASGTGGGGGTFVAIDGFVNILVRGGR